MRREFAPLLFEEKLGRVVEFIEFSCRLKVANVLRSGSDAR